MAKIHIVIVKHAIAAVAMLHTHVTEVDDDELIEFSQYEIRLEVSCLVTNHVMYN